MMKKEILNNKGQSLIEVVVALSLLAIVLVGIVTLAVNSTNLLLDSRDKTEAVAYAQKFMEEKKGNKSGITGSCLGMLATAGSFTPISDSKYQQKVEIADYPEEADLALVTVTVQWPSKGQPAGTYDRNIIVKEIMSRK